MKRRIPQVPLLFFRVNSWSQMVWRGPGHRQQQQQHSTGSRPETEEGGIPSPEQRQAEGGAGNRRGLDPAAVVPFLVGALRLGLAGGS
jgi:hypothetical protein